MPRLERTRKRIVGALSGPPVVFHHVPKCGGTSISRSLRLRYLLSYAHFDLRAISSAVESLHPCYEVDAVRDETVRFMETKLLTLMYRSTLCISGHIPFSSTAHRIFREKYNFITVLRDPVAFFTSFYFQNVYATEGRWQIDVPIEEFLESSRALIFGAFYPRFFSGLPPERHDETSLAIQCARENLAKFAAVGLVEDMECFQQRLSKELRLNLRIGHANRSLVPSSDRSRIITPDVRRKIEKVSEPNIEIYEFVKEYLSH